MLAVEPGEETRKQERDFSRFKEGRSALNRWQFASWKSQLLLFISSRLLRRGTRGSQSSLDKLPPSTGRGNEELLSVVWSKGVWGRLRIGTLQTCDVSSSVHFQPPMPILGWAFKCTAKMRTGFPMKCPAISRLSLRRGLRALREAPHNGDV